MPPKKSRNTSNRAVGGDQPIHSEIMKILESIKVSDGKYVYDTEYNIRWTIDLGLLNNLNDDIMSHAKAAILVVFASNLYDARGNTNNPNKSPEDVRDNMNYIIVNFVKGLEKCYKGGKVFDDISPVTLPVSITNLRQGNTNLQQGSSNTN
jgi:hypothetical protein